MARNHRPAPQQRGPGGASRRMGRTTDRRPTQLHDRAYAELMLAAAEVDEDRSLGGQPESASMILIARARHAVRGGVQALHRGDDETLPSWATSSLPDTHIALVNDVRQAMDWPTLHRMLGPHRHLLSSPDLRRSIEALTALYTMHSAPTILLGLLDEICLLYT